MPKRDNEGRILKDEVLQHRYQIERVLGSGGQGAVYEARDMRLQNLTVAIKESFVSQQNLNRAFEREAGLLALLRDDALPRVTDYFQEDGNWFLVMDFIEGKTLWDLMEIKDNSGNGFALAVELVREWADKLLAALEKLHSQSTPVIHNDIKPLNISITKDGQVKLLDFGLAKGAVGEMTIASTILHGYSAWYAPIEQILRAQFGVWYDVARRSVPQGELDRIAAQGTDARSDLYALAATLYHTLAGEPPDVSTFRLVDVAQGKGDSLRPVNEMNAKAPKAVAEVLQKAMAVYREERYASAAEMRQAWREAWEEKQKVQWFEFEVVTLDDKGNIKEQYKGRNRYITEDLGNGVLLHLAEIPAGAFWMGTSASEAAKVKAEYVRRGVSKEEAEGYVSWEMPHHKVNVSSFFMGIYVVTQEQWRAVASLPKVNRDLDADPSRFKGDTLPVEQVSWEEAKEFCARLTRATGKSYRLPSEAEWEYACRAGTTTPFAFGATITPDIVNYDGNYAYGNAAKGVYREKTVAVGSLGRANGFGLYDMHGNVWEWCEDVYHDDYTGAPVDGNVWLTPRSDGKNYRLLRGGSWNAYGRGCRSANRGRHSADYRYNYIGFRVVAVVRT